MIVLVTLYDKGWMREDLLDSLIATFQFEPLARPVFPYMIAIFLYILAIIVTSAVKSTKAVGIVLIVVSAMTMILVREINALAASASLLIAGIVASRYSRRKQIEKARNALVRFGQRLDKKYNIIEKADKAHSIQEWNDISHELYELLERYEGVLPPDVLHDLRGFTHTIDTRLDRILPKEIVEKYEDLMSGVQHAIAKTTTWQAQIHGVTGDGGASVISASAPLSTTTVAAVATVAAAGIGGIAYGSLNGYVPALPDLDIIVTSSADPEDIYRYLVDEPQQGLVEVSRESCFGSTDQVEQTFMPSQVQISESAQNPSTTTITIQLNAVVTALDNIFQTVATGTEPANVDVTEVTLNYMDIDENSFSIEPSSIERSQEGQTIIKWENVGQYAGNRDDKLSANETFSVSFSVGVLSNTGNASQRLPVSAEEESVVKYADPGGNIDAVMIPQTYVNINTQTCQEPPNGQGEFRLVYDKFIVPGSNNDTRGIYEEHSSNVFKPGEEISLYAEYAGMTQKPIDNGSGKTRYLVNTTGKFITTGKEGKVINATDIELNPFDTRTLDTNIVNHSSYYVFRNYIVNGSRDPGEYVISYTITDNLSGEKIEGTKDFIIEGIEQPLTVKIISNETVGVSPATFEFQANITGGTEPYTYLWNFGDGSEESNEETVQHTFEEAGTYNVNLTITDSEDQTAFVSLEITVKESPSGQGIEEVLPEDTTPPFIFVPDDITEEATSPDGATVFFEVSAQDDVDGAVDVSCNYNSGDTFPIGETVVTCNAEDIAHNAAEEESFAITVEEPPVEEPPVEEPPVEEPPVEEPPVEEPPVEEPPVEEPPANET